MSESAASKKQWRKGAVYKWSYKSTEGKFMPYHCKAGIGVVGETDKLVDTYWHGGGNEAWTRGEARRSLDLTFLANLEEFELAPATYVLDEYRPEDLLDLRHSNGGLGLFVRRGSRPCRDVVRAKLVRELEAAQAKVDSVTCLIARLDAGEPDHRFD